jgi:hypothetical protein
VHERASIKKQQSNQYLGSPIHDGRNEAARPTPVGNEVHEHGQLRLQHVCRELALPDELYRRAAPNARARGRELAWGSRRHAAASRRGMVRRQAERGGEARSAGRVERRAWRGREGGGDGARRGRHGDDVGEPVGEESSGMCQWPGGHQISSRPRFGGDNDTWIFFGPAQEMSLAACYFSGLLRGTETPIGRVAFHATTARRPGLPPAITGDRRMSGATATDWWWAAVRSCGEGRRGRAVGEIR